MKLVCNPQFTFKKESIMKMRTILLVILTAVMLAGCKTIVTQRDVVLLPEDRIYTVPSGQKIQVVQITGY